MRFRATMASLLTVILLSVSSAAANCATKCDLGSLAPRCHAPEGAGQSKDRPMPAMAGMGQHAAAQPSGAEAASFTAHSTTCRIHTCAAEPSMVATPKAVLSYASLVLGGVMPGELQFTPELARAGFSGPGPPRYQPATPVSLRTILRV